MKILIISDIHDNQINLNKTLNWAKKNIIDIMFCLGDVTTQETLFIMTEKFLGKIYLVKGNAEIYDEIELEKYANINYYGKIGIIEIDNIKIGICHEPYLLDEIKKEKEIKIIFHGHTHKPWQAEENGITIINPGTLGGGTSKATFAVWDSLKGSLELKLLEKL